MLRDIAAPVEGKGGILILRLRMPFDGSQSDRNLIMKVRKYSRVLDTENSLTSVPDFLTVARSLIEKRATGTYNVVNPGAISPYRIMELYREIVDPGHTFEKLTRAELPGEVRAGRSNCILSTAKLAREGITLEPVDAAIRRALMAYREARTPSVDRSPEAPWRRAQGRQPPALPAEPPSARAPHEESSGS
jgi:dTDP-4-dehydrorhamnose reductase